jgi:ribonuclease P protein component
LDAIRQSEHPEKLVLAFIWLDSRLHSSDEVEHKMKKLLYHIAEEKLQ